MNIHKLRHTVNTTLVRNTMNNSRQHSALIFRCERLYSCLKMVIVILAVGMTVGCTATTLVPAKKIQNAQPVENKLPEGKGWWFARFRIDWPKDSIPKWYLGTLLAGEVIAPVLELHHKNLTLWRFHRRAKRDGFGHVFSFMFYSSAPIARSIYNEIEQNALLLSLQQEKQITWVGLDKLNIITRPEIEDTSDADWPDSIRKTWPQFMVGASRMWLDLVLGLAEEQRKKGQQDKVLYQNVQNQLTRTWMMEGQRAWLHHLSALYAYQPTLIRY